MYPLYNRPFNPFAFTFPFLQFIILFLIVDFVLKAYALWKAGRNNQLWWFVALFVINSLGILPAIYLGFFQKNRSVTRKK